MSFMDAREHGSKPGSGGAASAQNEVSSAPDLASTACQPVCAVQVCHPAASRRLLLCRQSLCACSKGLPGAEKATGPCRSLASPRLDTGVLQAIDRRERLRRLALETIDLSKDPYFMRNHLGQVPRLPGQCVSWHAALQL